MANAKYYQLYKSEGRCTRCGKPAHKGGSMCLDCKEWYAAYMMAYRASHDRSGDAEKHKAYLKGQRAERRKNGLCVDCGAAADGKSWRCKKCNAKNATAAKKRRTEHDG